MKKKRKKITKIFKCLVELLLRFSPSQFLTCFSAFVEHHASTDNKIIKTLETKLGIAIISSVLQKGYEIMVYIYNSNEERELLRYWNQFFNMIFNSVIGKLKYLFETSTKQNNPSQIQIWDFVLKLSLSSDKFQKNQILTEISSLLQSVERNQIINTLIYILTNNM